MTDEALMDFFREWKNEIVELNLKCLTATETLKNVQEDYRNITNLTAILEKAQKDYHAQTKKWFQNKPFPFIMYSLASVLSVSILLLVISFFMRTTCSDEVTVKYQLLETLCMPQKVTPTVTATPTVIPTLTNQQLIKPSQYRNK